MTEEKIEGMPDLSGGKTTTEKITAFLDHITDESQLQRIYRFVEYIYLRED